MHLENISLNNFKNYESVRVQLSPEINCFVGKNGSGKTNLLDAIYYLSMTKSAFTGQDVQCMKHEETYFSIKGEYHIDGKKRVALCGLQMGKKKLLKLDDKPYKRASEHIGKLPLVLIAPNDTDVIRGGEEDRRKFFDAIIAQTDQVYLQNLIKYNHLMRQRNSLLKQFLDRNYFDMTLLKQYDNQLISLGKLIYQVRKAFVEGFQPRVVEHYQKLSEKSEAIALEYKSHFEGDIEQLFEDNLSKDRALKRTSIGIHKDEYPFLMDGRLMRKFGSQGQQKSYLIALKLSNFDFLQQEKAVKPLLLLDDIFDKLDDFRIARLMEMVASDAFGQIFVTDARPERTFGIFENIAHEVKIFSVEQGAIEEILK
jgi:DNA replication and repair protein RecF